MERSKNIAKEVYSKLLFVRESIAIDILTESYKTIRAEVLKDAADRAVEWLNEPVDIPIAQYDSSLREAILAGEVKASTAQGKED